MNTFQFLTAIKRIADKHGIEVRVNLRYNAIGFVGNYDIKTRDICEKEIDKVFKYAGTIKTSRAVYGEKPGNC
jgi:hypothetical protein